MGAGTVSTFAYDMPHQDLASTTARTDAAFHDPFDLCPMLDMEAFEQPEAEEVLRCLGLPLDRR